MRFLILAAAALATPTAAVASAAPLAAHAPGRVVFSVNGGAVAKNVDGGGAGSAVALPNGGAVLVGGAVPGQAAFYVAQLSAGGALDSSFGTGGVAQVHLGLPMFVPGKSVRQPDGKLVIAGSGAPAGRFESAQSVLVRLNPDGSLDPGFGVGGVDALAVQTSCGGCSLALAPDGGLVVGGTTGLIAPPLGADPGAGPESRAVVTRLRTSGALDQSFGSAGIVTLTGSGGAGLEVSVAADGDILALSSASVLGNGPGGRSTAEFLTRLLASGAVDPAFGGGAPVALPAGAGSPVLLAPDDSVVVGLATGLARYTPAGVLDPAFGSGGVDEIFPAPACATQQAPASLICAIQQPFARISQLLPAPGGGVLVVRQGQADAGRTQVERIAAGGAVDPTLGGPSGIAFTIPFGGGGSSVLVSQSPRPLPPLAQDSFRSGLLLARSDGSYLAFGGVLVSQPTGEGTGNSIFDFAAAALTPSFGPDVAFGGPAVALSVRLGVPAQRAATALGRRGIRVTLNVSAPGLARVAIKAGGRVVAQSLLPVFAAGPVTLPVELSAYGERLLRRHRSVALRASVSARDLLANTGSASASGSAR